MKKITGILGVVAIAMAIFFSTNLKNSSNSDLDLATIISINAANAENGSGSVSYCSPGNSGCSTATWCHKVSYNWTCNGG